MSLKGSWSKHPPSSKFLISVGIIFTCAIVFSLISVGMVMLNTGIPFEHLKTMLDGNVEDMNISVLKTLQLFDSIGTFIVPALLLAYLFSFRSDQYLYLDRFPRVVPFLFVAALLIVAVPLINYLASLNEQMKLPSFLSGVENWMRESEDKNALLTEKFLRINSTGDLIYSLLVIALIPALGEELLFRGILQRIFKEWSRNAHAGIWLSAALFSALHFQFFGFLPRMLLGALFGYLLEWSGKLWLPILGHFVNNAFAVLLVYFYQDNMTDINPDTIGTQESDLIFLVTSVVLTIFLLVLIYKREKKSVVAG